MAKGDVLAPGVEKIVDELVTKGRYRSRAEVLSAGIRLLEEREAKLSRLHAMIEEGIRSAERQPLVDVDDAFGAAFRRLEAVSGR